MIKVSSREVGKCRESRETAQRFPTARYSIFCPPLWLIVKELKTKICPNRADFEALNVKACPLGQKDKRCFNKARPSFYVMIMNHSIEIKVCARNSEISEARARRNSSPQPPPSVAPERTLGGCKITLAILQEMVSSRTVKIHHNLIFCKFADHFVGGTKCRPSISPRQILSARRGEPRLAVGQDEVRLPCDFNSVSDLLCPIIV